MSYTMEDLKRDVARQHLRELTVEERIDELLECVPADEVLERRAGTYAHHAGADDARRIGVRGCERR